MKKDIYKLQEHVKFLNGLLKRILHRLPDVIIYEKWLPEVIPNDGFKKNSICQKFITPLQSYKIIYNFKCKCVVQEK